MFTNAVQIFLKELRSYFQSRMAWFVFVVYIAISMAATFFQSRFLTQTEPVMSSFFKLQADIFALLIPALTIKLWSDEKRQGTWELTSGLPISYTAITFGKFLAVWALCGLMLLSTFGLWISSAWVTGLDNPAIAANYMSCLLLCGGLCAISMCASAFSAHPISAFVLSLAVCIGFSLVNFTWLVGLFGFSSEVMLRAAGALNFGSRFAALIAGQASFATLFYFVSLIFFALWLNIAFICWRTEARGGRALFVAYIIAAFAALNIAITLLTGPMSFDFSPDKRFSLSAETKLWLAQNDNNIYIRLYYSPQTVDKDYLSDVLRLLEQYQLYSRNKLSLFTVEVTPLSVAETEAQKAGIKAEDGKIRLGLSISDSLGNFRTIPDLNPKRSDYLEHDISRVLSSMGHYQRPNIGIMSSDLAPIATDDTLDYTTDWPFAAVLRQNYNLKPISDQASLIPADIKLLMIINPQQLSAVTIYAIDQYLMRGGNILIFMDPLSEVALAGSGIASQQSNLQEFLAHLGIVYHDNMVVGDNLYNRAITLSAETKTYPFWLNVVPDAAADSLIAGLKPLALNTAGWFNPDVDAMPQTRIIFATSKQSGEVEASFLRHASWNETMDAYLSDEQQRPLAVLQEGRFTSLYDHPLSSVKIQPFLSVSVKDGKIMLVADSDILDSRLWNANQDEEQTPYDYEPFSGNMDFVERAVDYLSNNQAILNITPKISAVSGAPIAAMLMLDAEAEYAATQAEKNARLAQINQQQAQIYLQLRQQDIIPSVQAAKQLENLEKERLNLLEDLKDLQARIIQTYKTELGLFMAFNFVAPLLILGLCIIVNHYHRRRLRQKFERIING